MVLMIAFLITKSIYIIYSVIFLGLLTGISTFIRNKIHQFWMIILEAISKVMATVQLSILYIYIFMLGVFKKMFSKKMIHKKTNFKDVKFIHDKKYFERSW